MTADRKSRFSSRAQARNKKNAASVPLFLLVSHKNHCSHFSTNRRLSFLHCISIASLVSSYRSNPLDFIITITMNRSFVFDCAPPPPALTTTKSTATSRPTTVRAKLSRTSSAPTRSNNTTTTSPRKSALPPKKRKVSGKHLTQLPMTILKRQVASKWTAASFSHGSSVVTPAPPPITGSAFYLERYGEKALSLYPKGPQTLKVPRTSSLQVVGDPAKFLRTLDHTTPTPTTTSVPLNVQIPQEEHSQQFKIPTPRKANKASVESIVHKKPAAAVVAKTISQGSVPPRKASRQGVVTPSPMGMILPSTTTTMATPSMPSRTLQPSPLKRSSSSRRLALGMAHDPINLVDNNNNDKVDDDYSTLTGGTLSTGPTNRAITQGSSNVPYLQGGSVSVGHVQFAVPARYVKNMPPGPDRTTTRQAFRPVRKVSLTNGTMMTPPSASSSSITHSTRGRRRGRRGSSCSGGGATTQALTGTTATTVYSPTSSRRPTTNQVVDFMPPPPLYHAGLSPPYHDYAARTSTTTSAISATTTYRHDASSANNTPAATVPHHPLYQAHHSGRRSAAFSPTSSQRK